MKPKAFGILATVVLAASAAPRGGRPWTPLTLQVRQFQNDPVCERLRNLHVYSNAFVHQETGDTLGNELAVGDLTRDSAAFSALLFDYEGSPNLAPISMKGTLNGGTLALTGTWVLTTTNPDGTHPRQENYLAKVVGRIDSRAFEGTVQIGYAPSERVVLRPVASAMMCIDRNGVRSRHSSPVPRQR